MGCIESWGVRPLVCTFRLAAPTSGSRRIWSKTPKRGCSAPATTPQRSFSLYPFPHAPKFSRFMWWMRLILSSRVLISARGKRYRYHVHSGHVSPSRSICVSLSPVSRTRARAFIRRNEARLLYCGFSSFLIVNDALASNRCRLMPDLIERPKLSLPGVSLVRRFHVVSLIEMIGSLGYTTFLKCCYRCTQLKVTRHRHVRKFVFLAFPRFRAWILDPLCILNLQWKKVIRDVATFTIACFAKTFFSTRPANRHRFW